MEYYIGDAVSKGADTILTTGALQSNHVRMTIAAARKLGLEVEVQLEQRVSGRQDEYFKSGNPFLMQLMGAKIHHYPVGEDEEGADRALQDRADEIVKEGGKPYVIPLSRDHIPYGALGYVDCAGELLSQMDDMNLKVDGIILATGSGTTHAGLLVGLRARQSNIPIYGICVRRDQDAQADRVYDKSVKVSQMIEHTDVVHRSDVHTDDQMLHPGYGQLNENVTEALHLAAKCEGILLDPTYTAKSMAGLIHMVRNGKFNQDQNIVFLHTGGSPALFGYPEILPNMLKDTP